jgi:hypothetical protein
MCLVVFQDALPLLLGGSSRWVLVVAVKSAVAGTGDADFVEKSLR